MKAITPVDVTPGTTGSFQDVDVTTHVGSDAGSVAGVVLQIVNSDTTVPYNAIVRKNGSTDSPSYDVTDGPGQAFFFVGVDSSDIFEINVENAAITVYLVGYTVNDSSSFFTNALVKDPGADATWADVDISSDTGADTAIGVFLTLDGSSSSVQASARKNGSTDSVVSGSDLFSGRGYGLVVGADGSEIFEIYGEGATAAARVDFLVQGYIKQDATLFTNRVDYSEGSTTGSYVDVDFSSDIPASNNGAFFHFFSVTGQSVAIRKNGASYDYYADTGEATGGWVEIDTNRVAEQKIETTNQDLYLLGYSNEPSSITAALTGTVTSSIDEDDITTGGKTIILTLTGDTWVTSGATFEAQRQNIIDGIDSAQSEGTGWDAEVKANLAVTTVVRTSDTVVTVTLSAQSGYDITAQETITATIPATALTTSASAVVASPTFTVDFVRTGGDGQIAVYREATGTEDEDNQTIHDETFDTTVREDDEFQLQGDNASVDLLTGGHYFITYNLSFSGDGVTNLRTEHVANLDLAGTNQSIGYSSGYIRNSGGANYAYLQGGGIINSTAGQDIKVECQNTSTSTTTSAQRRANLCGLMLLKLDDDWDYLRLHETTAGSEYGTGSFTDFTWDTQDEYDTGSFTHSTSTNSQNITLKTAGHYLVSYNLSFVGDGSSRTQVITKATLDSTDIEQSYSGTYLRGTNGCDNGVTGSTFIVETTSTNQVLEILVNNDSEDTSGTITDVASQSAITIAKIPDTGDFIRIHETTGDQDVDATNSPITFDTNDEVDSGSFTHSTSTNTDDITLNSNGDYLFTFGGYELRNTLTDADRITPIFEWRNDTTKYTYGSMGAFNRGDQSTTGTFASAQSGSIIVPDASNTEVIDLVVSDESTGASVTYLKGDKYGITGLRIGSLFAAAADAISKVNTVSYSAISKVNTIAKASISKINTVAN